MAQAAEVLGDKWTLLIIREAFYGVVRYEDMRSDLGIPRSVLSDRLASLVRTQILQKFEYAEPGSRLRKGYQLTEAGMALAPVMLALTRWGEQYVTRTLSPVVAVSRRTKEQVELMPVDRQGNVVDWRHVELSRVKPNRIDET